MAAKQFVVIVTGANKGIGLECVRVLASHLPSSHFYQQVGASSGVVYLTSRDEGRGRAALEEVKPSAAKGVQVELAVLDVTSQASVDKFRDLVKEKHEKVHALINNAGVSDGVGGVGGKFDLQTVDWVFSCNYDGVKRMTEAFLPLMHERGRIINISSGMTRLAALQLRQRALGVKSVAEADKLVAEFKEAVQKGTVRNLGYPEQAYPSSKILLNALTRGFAEEVKSTHPHLLMNYVNPGWVKTDMGGPSAPGSVRQGADTPCWLAVDDVPERSGVGFASRAEIPW